MDSNLGSNADHSFRNEYSGHLICILLSKYSNVVFYIKRNKMQCTQGNQV